jgi:hypothetical protein
MKWMSYVDSYAIKSENLSITFLPPHPLLLPRCGEGKDKGEIPNMFGYFFVQYLVVFKMSSIFLAN